MCLHLASLTIMAPQRLLSSILAIRLIKLSLHPLLFLHHLKVAVTQEFAAVKFYSPVLQRNPP